MSEVKFTDSRSFILALNSAAKSIPPELMSRVQRALLLGALDGIVKRTPVDTGRARGNWQVTQDTPSAGPISNLDASGGSTVALGGAAIAQLDPFSRAFISNNLPYIGVLEYGGYPPPSATPRKTRSYKFVTSKGVRRRVKLSAKVKAREEALGGPKVNSSGYSLQAPRGMVRITFEEMKAQVEAIAAAGLGDA